MVEDVNHKNEKRTATEGAACRNESENRPAHGRACNYPDMCVHCGELARSQLNPEPDYEEEGMFPHN